MRQNGILKSIALVIAVLLLTCGSAFAQALTSPQSAAGTLSGIVVDETGAAISDAEIVVASPTTGLQRSARTNSDGDFLIPLLPAGEYVVTAQREGFAAAEMNGVKLQPDRVTRLRMELKVDSLSESVVVSAQKREQRLQDVPASIVVASAQTIADLNMVEVTELDAVAPGLTFATKPGRFGTGPGIAIRGISTFTQSPAIQDSVSVVLDDVPISRAKAGTFPDLSDVERIEVLRGPQGTLFGKNASAGVISLTTKDPTNDRSSELALDYGTYNSRTIRGAVAGPIIKNVLLGRVSFYGKWRDGFIRNVFDNTLWDNDQQAGFRGKLLYKGSRDTFRISTDFIQQSNDGGTQPVRAFLPNSPQYYRRELSDLVTTENDRINSRPEIGSTKNRQRTGGIVARWDRPVGGHTLTAITGYRRFTQDADPPIYYSVTPLDVEWRQIFRYHARQYSGELRLASPTKRRLEYVAGLFVFADIVESALRNPDPGAPTLSGDGQIVGRVQTHWANETSGRNYAAFGQADARISDRLTLTVGLRGTSERVAATIVGLPTSPDATHGGVPVGTTKDAKSANDLSWRIGGQWRADADRMFYVTAATGFKGPGFNVVSGIAGNAQPVKPETSTSVEGGFKSQFFARKLTFNVSAYRATYRDYQTQGFTLIPGTQLGQVVLSNVGKLRTTGFEAELAARVSESTDISVNATHIDAVMKEFRNAPCYTGQPVGPGACSATGASGQQDLSGKRLANTPAWAFNVLGKQRFRLPVSGWNGVGTVDYGWRSNVQWDLLGHPLAVENGYGLLGASLGVERAADRFSVKLYGKNLTNQFHTSGMRIGTAVFQFLPVDYRRVIGVEMSVKF